MVIVFRTDASREIGSGHLVRCLTLALDLREKGYECMFICRNGADYVQKMIKQYGFAIQEIFYEGQFHCLKDVEETKRAMGMINKPINWLIIDHYQIDVSWEKKVRHEVDHILVIDDLANRKHDCDILLDQNYYRNLSSRYDCLVPDKCIKLLGPEFLLLRKEFYELEKRDREFSTSTKRLFVFYGGSDYTNETLKAIKALGQIDRSSLSVDIVVGALNPNKDLIKTKCKLLNLNYYQQISNIAELINKADFSLGAGGIALWERLYLGLPSIVTIVADNQKETVDALHEQDMINNLGWHEEVTVEMLAEAISKYRKESRLRHSQIEKVNQLFNNKHNNMTVIEAMLHVSMA